MSEGLQRPGRGAERSGREEPTVQEKPGQSDTGKDISRRGQSPRGTVGGQRGQWWGGSQKRTPVLPQGYFVLPAGAPCSEPPFQEMIVALGVGQAGRTNLEPAPFCRKTSLQHPLSLRGNCHHLGTQKINSLVPFPQGTSHCFPDCDPLWGRLL